jgi:uroporphyrinogen decarboxylase
VDRIPNGLGGCETAGLHNVAYDQLKKVLGVEEAANRMCSFMCNAVFEPGVIEAMSGDIVLLGSKLCPSRLWTPSAAREWKSIRLWDVDLQVSNQWDFRRDDDGTWWWGAKKCPPGSYYFDPPAGSAVAQDFDQLARPSPAEFNPPHSLPDELLQRLQDDARWLYEDTDLCIACGEMTQDLQVKPGGLQSWWMRMVEEPEACHEMLGKAVDAALAQIRQLDQAIGPYCSILGIADDMGDQRGITIGPDLWRSIYKPHYKRLFTEWHRITRMKVNLHTCGAMTDLLDDLIECGVDIYNPVQTSARGMDPATLKSRFGDRLIFYGGVFDEVSLPPSTNPEIVYEKVKASIRTLSRGGGYVFAGVHNLPGDLPAPHLAALLQAWRDCRHEAACLRPDGG